MAYDKDLFPPENVYIFLISHLLKQICCEYPLEVPPPGTSCKYPQLMFLL